MGMGGRSGGKGLEQSQIEFCVWLKIRIVGVFETKE